MMMRPSMNEETGSEDDATLTFRDVTREWRKSIMTELTKKLEGETPAARKEANEVVRKGTPAQRRALLVQYGIELPPWEAADPAWLFDDLKFETAGECLDALGDRFLAIPPTAEQRALLLTALGFDRADAPAKPEIISVRQDSWKGKALL